MPRKKRALLMTVGTGTGDKRCSLAHGLMCSIDSKDPDFICFFVSKDSKPTVDALKKVFNNKFDEDFDECYDYEFVEMKLLISLLNILMNLNLKYLN